MLCEGAGVDLNLIISKVIGQKRTYGLGLGNTKFSQRGIKLSLNPAFTVPLAFPMAYQVNISQSDLVINQD